MTTFMFIVYIVSLLLAGFTISSSRGVFSNASVEAVRGYNKSATSHGRKEVGKTGAFFLRILGYFVVVGLVVIPVVNTIFIIVVTKKTVNRHKEN